MLVAAWIWWQARSSGFFFVVGLQGSASTNLGPLLPAICGGLSAALMLLIADAAAGPWAGAVATVALVLLPGFMPLHRASLTGPPLLTTSLLMLAAMIHAPRFSIAYGSIGAVGGIFVATEGVGLPFAAAGWALLQPGRERGRWQRVLLALAPTVVVLFLAHLLGGAWPHSIAYGWRGGLDRALRSGGTILGDQMAPTITYPALRFLVLADFALVIAALALVGWRRVGRVAGELTPMRTIYPAAGLVAAALLLGLVGRTLLVADSPEPDLSAMLPLVALTLLILVVSIAGLWARWPTWARVMTVVLVGGWIQAAARS